ncbi:MAG TPA: glycerate kinase [Thermodesulforhabdus norvegica]|uniref:Glycerate kinase n=1 Tax=Thermodesulforhabdus norvegica TaxID=39841 RepID=A0A7C1AXA6_9BACT|nr:glycerate kinase [Thermodesulforhabdus norvegica]
MKVKKCEILQELFKTGIDAVSPERVVKRAVKRDGNVLHVDGKCYFLRDFERIYVIGAGKATAPMARVLEELLYDRIAGGGVVVKYGHGLPLEKIAVYEGGHPIPDESSYRGTESVLNVVRDVSERDLVFCIFSGGGSALFVSPLEPLTLADKQVTTDALLRAGAPIEAVNTVRKHLSKVKGGRLARFIYPARVITVLLSDVIGDRLDVIASGPTVPDTTTYDDCYRVLHDYGIWDEVPEAVQRIVNQGRAGLIEDTPKSGDPVFEKVQTTVAGNNRLALGAAAEVARRNGYNVVVVTSRLQGEAREVAKVLAAMVEEILFGQGIEKPPVCLLFGGETTVTVKGSGTGGRNQELALALAIALKNVPGWSGFSVGTDGTDGPTDVAGAMVDGEVFKKAVAKGLDPHAFIRNNDSYNFFKQMGLLVKTGPTRTNVMDMICLLIDGM